MGSFFNRRFGRGAVGSGNNLLVGRHVEVDRLSQQVVTLRGLGLNQAVALLFGLGLAVVPVGGLQTLDSGLATAGGSHAGVQRVCLDVGIVAFTVLAGLVDRENSAVQLGGVVLGIDLFEVQIAVTTLYRVRGDRLAGG